MLFPQSSVAGTCVQPCSCGSVTAIVSLETSIVTSLQLSVAEASSRIKSLTLRCVVCGDVRELRAVVS